MNQWTVVPSPNVPNRDNILNGVSAADNTHVWAAGYTDAGSASTAQTLIQFWNGSAWTIQTSPNVAGSGNELQGVAAVSSTEAWAVGGVLGGPWQTLVEHTTNGGTTWTIESSPSNAAQGWGASYLNAVAVASSSYVWAAGYYNTIGNQTAALLEVWRPGVGWVVPAQPNIAGGIYYGIYALDTNHIWAVGAQDVNNTTLPLVVFWDGIRWTPVSAPARGTINILNAVAGTNANDVWAVGTADNNTWTIHWNGTTWSDSYTSIGSNTYYGVGAVDMNFYAAVGYLGLVPPQYGQTANWNGTAWVQSANSLGANTTLDGVTVVPGTNRVSGGNLWAAGWGFDTSQGHFQTLIVNYNIPANARPAPGP
ncbi:MAG TPA: hypothetical protein VKY74_26295 [Chloroflexia bacterium]|nr:hypothetical protein [Chloroflexia bacterium]